MFFADLIFNCMYVWTIKMVFFCEKVKPFEFVNGLKIFSSRLSVTKC